MELVFYSKGSNRLRKNLNYSIPIRDNCLGIKGPAKLIMSKELTPLHHTPSYCDAYLNPEENTVYINVVRHPNEIS